MSCSSSLSLAFGLFLVLSVNCEHPKYEEIARIEDRYELIDLDYDLSFERSNDLTRVSFDAFGERYDLYLELNEQLIGNRINHVNDIPSETLGYFTSLSQSCHYHINGKLSNGIIGGASICPKRGFRGRIRTGNDTLVIAPANYFLNLTFDGSDECFHDISDKHLIYKTSDYKDFNNDKQDFETYKMNEHNNNHNNNSRNHINNNNNNNNNKRNLLQTINNGVQNIEVLVIVLKSLYDDFYNEYGSGSYYEELVLFIADTLTYVNDVFINTDWGNDIGTINIGFAQLEIITDYTGVYASVTPPLVSGTSEVDSTQLLYNFRDYIQAYKDTSFFDSVMLFGSDDLDGVIQGRAFPSSLCDDPYDNVLVAKVDSTNHVETVSHELGHNLGADHDQDTSCGMEGGIMGYGMNDWMFSSCTISSVQNFFSNGCGGSGGDCDCVADSMSWMTDYPDSSDLSYYTCNNTSAKCVEIDNLVITYDGSSVDMSDIYSYQGCWYGYPYYEGIDTGYYLYWTPYWGGNSGTGSYHIFHSKSYANGFAYCFSTDLNDCDSNNGNNPTNWRGMDLYAGTFSYPTYNDYSVKTECNCVEIENSMQVVWDAASLTYDLSGVYTYDSDENGYAMYKGTIDNVEWYMLYYPSWYGYAISTSTNAASDGWAYCAKTDVTQCKQDDWEVYINSWGNWDDDATCDYTIC